MNTLPFRRYVSLYTLHRIERHYSDRDYAGPPGDLLVLRVRIDTLRYSLEPLLLPDVTREIDAAYRVDPRAGIDRVRQVVLPRLDALLNAPDPFEALAGSLDWREALWQRYAAERGLPAEPVAVPAISAPIPVHRLPDGSATSRRLAQAQRWLQTVQMAAETTSTLAALWQNWRIRQGQRALLDAQRDLLHNTIQAQLAGQDSAFTHALDQNFVRGYLADHAGDAGHDAVFGPDAET